MIPKGDHPGIVSAGGVRNTRVRGGILKQCLHKIEFASREFVTGSPLSKRIHCRVLETNSESRRFETGTRETDWPEINEWSRWVAGGGDDDDGDDGGGGQSAVASGECRWRGTPWYFGGALDTRLTVPRPRLNLTYEMFTRRK